MVEKHILNNLYNLTRSHASILSTAIDRFAATEYRERNSLVMTTLELLYFTFALCIFFV